MTDPQLPRSDSSPVVGGSASGRARFTQALSVLENDADAAVVGSGFHTGGPDLLNLRVWSSFPVATPSASEYSEVHAKFYDRMFASFSFRSRRLGFRL